MACVINFKENKLNTFIKKIILYRNTVNNLLGTCNTGCNCTDVRFEPICSFDNVQYYSPCHAGCINSTEIDGKEVRAGSLYSTVDESRQGVFWFVGEKKIKNKICLPANVGGRKKNKRKI